MRRLATVALVVPDYDEALAFYADKLGFAVLADDERGNGKRWVVVSPGPGGSAVLLARAADAEQARAIGAQAGGRVGFFLETDDFDRDHAEMVAAGVLFEETPRDEPYGRVAVWRDPFGNCWDLLERRPESN